MSTRALTKVSNLFPALQEDLFRPFNEWFGNGGLFPKTLSVPAVNIAENTNEYQVLVGVPGMKKNDFNIDVAGNMLTISCEKEETKENKEAQYTRKEYSYSSFSRSFTLPEEVSKDKIEATYEDGVLKISLPKKEDAKKAALSKHIQVK